MALLRVFAKNKVKNVAHTCHGMYSSFFFLIQVPLDDWEMNQVGKRTRERVKERWGCETRICLFPGTSVPIGYSFAGAEENRKKNNFRNKYKKYLKN